MDAYLLFKLVLQAAGVIVVGTVNRFKVELYVSGRIGLTARGKCCGRQSKGVSAEDGGVLLYSAPVSIPTLIHVLTLFNI